MKIDKELKNRKGIVAIVVFGILLVFIIAFVARESLNYESFNKGIDSLFIKNDKKEDKDKADDNTKKYPLVHSFEVDTYDVEVKRFLKDDQIYMNVKINDVDFVKDYYLNTLENEEDCFKFDKENLFIINGNDNLKYLGIELFDSVNWNFYIYNETGLMIYDSKDDTALFTEVDNDLYKDGRAYYVNEGKAYIMEVQTYGMEDASFKEKQIIIRNDNVTKRFIKNYKGSTGAEG